jgi:CBS-domain-containing membrane protein
LVVTAGTASAAGRTFTIDVLRGNTIATLVATTLTATITASTTAATVALVSIAYQPNQFIGVLITPSGAGTAPTDLMVAVDLF